MDLKASQWKVIQKIAIEKILAQDELPGANAKTLKTRPRRHTSPAKMNRKNECKEKRKIENKQKQERAQYYIKRDQELQEFDEEYENNVQELNNIIKARRQYLLSQLAKIKQQSHKKKEKHLPNGQSDKKRLKPRKGSAFDMTHDSLSEIQITKTQQNTLTEQKVLKDLKELQVYIIHQQSKLQRQLLANKDRVDKQYQKAVQQLKKLHQRQNQIHQLKCQCSYNVRL